VQQGRLLLQLPARHAQPEASCSCQHTLFFTRGDPGPVRAVRPHRVKKKIEGPKNFYISIGSLVYYVQAQPNNESNNQKAAAVARRLVRFLYLLSIRALFFFRTGPNNSQGRPCPSQSQITKPQAPHFSCAIKAPSVFIFRISTGGGIHLFSSGRCALDLLSDLNWKYAAFDVISIVLCSTTVRGRACSPALSLFL
jgi:hypothetical protein